MSFLLRQKATGIELVGFGDGSGSLWSTYPKEFIPVGITLWAQLISQHFLRLAITPALYLISSVSDPYHLVWLFVLTQAEQIISFATNYPR